jgi:hypothetical protein
MRRHLAGFKASPTKPCKALKGALSLSRWPSLSREAAVSSAQHLTMLLVSLSLTLILSKPGCEHRAKSQPLRGHPWRILEIKITKNLIPSLVEMKPIQKL